MIRRLRRAAKWLALSTCAIATPSLGSPLQCRIDMLQSLGWNPVERSGQLQSSTANACESFVAPVFEYNPDPALARQMINRADRALDSDASRCLISRRYGRSVRVAVTKLMNNREFKFPHGGSDPRDPFIPPPQSWAPARKRGYDSPLSSVAKGIESLYSEPFIAECAAAKQIAQVASLYELFPDDIDQLLHPREIGIGLWQRYLTSPAIVAQIPLHINGAQRGHALRRLAALGRYAFNGQMGYIRPAKGGDYIDSPDNRGQNFLITEIGDDAVAALRARARPLKELSAISTRLWKKYSRAHADGRVRDELRREFEAELTDTDPFFRDVKIYVHPLGVRTFAYHIARQFRYNPRTPYSIEMYEDHMSGYAYQRFLTRGKLRCDQQAYCRAIDKRTYLMVGKDGAPRGASYRSLKSCLKAAAKQ